MDAVITWVDGKDPVLNEKRRKWGDERLFAHEDIAGATRYADIGEIFWCVVSLNRFAPFIHKIYIVTDGQDPGLESRMAELFPDGHIPMEIVDHKVIYRGFEQYLPVFNSIAVESMTWRIPELEEYYLELNDDFILSAPVYESDFIDSKGRFICYGQTNLTLITRLTRLLKKKKDGLKAVTFKGMMMNAATLEGRNATYLRLSHTPRILSRSFFERYYSEHPEALERNISHRFRDPSQFNPEELLYLACRRKGGLKTVNPSKVHFFLQKKSSQGYVEKKMELLKRRAGVKFCCFNSLDKCDPAELKLVTDWIENTLMIQNGTCEENASRTKSE